LRIENFFRHIQKIIDSCSVVQASTIMFDKRSTYEGYIRGDIFFVDDSALHFREFVDVEIDDERLMYVYQYLSSSNNLIFRYDNTGHHRKLRLPSYPHHKHDGRESNVTPAAAMDLTSVIQKIELMIQLP
jgi:hypothetical protein